MNKTININLASTFFYIDEDAYDVLQHYLKRLESAFKKTVGKDEILGDIEARIAELFQEYKKHTSYVINKNDVAKMIETLGQPEDFAFEEEPQSASKQKTRQRKLFRDSDDQFIGGVASGMGHYFGIDSVWMRLIWLSLGLFSGGSVLFIYILFWILIPKAVTTADKLKMKGEPVNIANIERKIKEEFEEVTERIKNVDYDEAKSSLKKKSKNFFNFLENLLVLLLKSLTKIIGFVLILISLISIIGICVSFISFNFIGFFDWPLTLLNSFFELGNYPIWVPVLMLFFIIIIPFIFIFILGIKLVVPTSNPFGLIGRFVLLVVWLTSIILLVVFSLSQVRSRAVLAHYDQEKVLLLEKNNILRVGLKTTDFKKNEQPLHFNDFKFYYDTYGEKWLYGENIQLNIEPSMDNTTTLEIKRIANGKDFKTAKEKAKAIVFDSEIKEYDVKIASNWETSIENKFYNQQVRVNLRIAEGQKIKISKNIRHLLKRSIPNDQDFSRRKIPNNTWIMGKNELKCLDCKANL